jgi:hypothetical protein
MNISGGYTRGKDGVQHKMQREREEGKEWL